MSTFKSRLKSVCSCINKIADKGALEPDQKKALLRALKDLEHASSIKDHEAVKRAVDKISRIFLCSIG